MMSRHPLAARVPWPDSETAEVPYERPAPRTAVEYACARGHILVVAFAAAEPGHPAAPIPVTRECRCGAPARTSHPEAADPPPTPRRPRTARTPDPDEETGPEHHIRLVRQRRTPAAAAEILAEAIERIRR